MHTCRTCNQSFGSELALELHRDTCTEGRLICGLCGDQFREAEATEDGWYYACPNDDCSGEGLTEDLLEVGTATR